jgi:dihydroneopterin aldolase
MSARFNISLYNLRFFAHHGLYEEEIKLGNEFEVNVEVQFSTTQDLVRKVEDTCDYAALYSLISQEMKIPRKLLETLAMETVEKIHTTFPQLSSISYSITKLYAPIAKFKGQVNVQFRREYSPT